MALAEILELLLEGCYHGDTALCAFGPGRRFLLAFERALEPEGWRALREATPGPERVIPLSEADAARYAANSFALTQGGDSVLVMPEGCSDRLRAQVGECGVTPLPVDVSELLEKGGGSVKCMIGDPGPVGEEELAEVPIP